jgi:hypothetical protein
MRDMSVPSFDRPVSDRVGDPVGDVAKTDAFSNASG